VIPALGANSEVMAVLEGLLMAGAVGLIVLSLLNVARRSEQEQRLRDAFYALLETQDSCVSLIQLAANSRADATRTKEFLDTQAQVFSAMLEIDPEGNTFYRFPKVQQQTSLPAVLRDDWQENS
jgi:hypothetical protein